MKRAQLVAVTRSLSLAMGVVGIAGGIAAIVLPLVGRGQATSLDVLVFVAVVMFGAGGIMLPIVSRSDPRAKIKALDRFPSTAFLCAAFASLFAPYGTLLAIPFVLGAVLNYVAVFARRRLVREPQ